MIANLAIIMRHHAAYRIAKQARLRTHGKAATGIVDGFDLLCCFAVGTDIGCTEWRKLCH